MNPQEQGYWTSTSRQCEHMQHSQCRVGMQEWPEPGREWKCSCRCHSPEASDRKASFDALDRDDQRAREAYEDIDRYGEGE